MSISPKQSGYSAFPDKLGIDELEYLPSTPIDTTTIVPNLSVRSYYKFYNDNFLAWEKKTYGWNFDLQKFVLKNGESATPSRFIPRKRDINEPIIEAPYPLHRDFSSSASISIPIQWKPTKHDIWYKENFSWEKRTLYNDVSIARFEYRDPIEFQRVQLVNSILSKQKTDTTKLNSTPTKSIKQIKLDIKRRAKLDLKPKIGSTL